MSVSMKLRPSAILLSAVGLLSLSAVASAQPQNPPVAPAPAEPDAAPATTVDALVVRAARPGPAFWKVTRGASTVWVMGAPSALPKGLPWKQDELKAHLRNARVLIVGTGGYTFNIADIFTLIFSGKQFRSDQPLSATLPPDLLARYEAARSGLRAPERVNELKPGFAGVILSSSFQRSLNMDFGQPERTITRDAFLRVHSERVGRSDVVDVIKIFSEMSPAMARTCVEDAVRQVEAGRDRMLEAARGWTTGDLRVAISAERGLDNCIERDPRVAAESARNMTEVTNAILEALNKPGKAVAVVDLRPLLTKGGIIERLMAQPGVKVITPDVPGLDDEITAEAAQPETDPMPTGPAI